MDRRNDPASPFIDWNELRSPETVPNSLFTQTFPEPP
jgi:hypothetical protein